MELENIFGKIDDFCLVFEPIFNAQVLPARTQIRVRKTQLCLSEVMTIIIYFHISGYRNFKDYYLKHLTRSHQKEFPKLVSYNRFLQLIPSALIPLMCYLNSQKGENTGLSFIDSMSIPICHPKRAKRNKVFQLFEFSSK